MSLSTTHTARTCERHVPTPEECAHSSERSASSTPRRAYRTWRPSRILLAVLLPALATLGNAAAQPDDADVPLDATYFVVGDEAPEGLWLELTPLALPGTQEAENRDLRPAVLLPEDSAPGLTWLPERTAGPAMLCRGVDADTQEREDEAGTRTWAVACELIAVWRDDPEALLPPPDDPRIVVEAVTGPPVVGRYLVGNLPVAGAAVSVVPARLDTPVPFRLPLIWTGGRFARRLATDDEGFFRLPRLAPGDYVLEAELPGGRLHRSDVVTVPEIADLRYDAGAHPDEDLVFDLGDVDVRQGLTLDVRATDAMTGAPMPGVHVALRQGETPADLVTFRARTGDDGVARFDGLVVEMPSSLACAAPGLATVRHEWQLLPVSVDCEMEPLAALAGQIFDPDGEPIPATHVQLFPADVDGAVTGRASRAAMHETTAGGDGAFLFADVAGGTWRLQAAAPGFRVDEQIVRLDAGERRLLDAITLLPGREVLVRVKGPDGEPVPGAEIIAVEPAGAVATTADADGEALFAHPGPETTIEVTGLEYAAERVTLPSQTAPSDPSDAAKGPFDVILRPGGWIRVLVSLGRSDESANATPCSGCELWIEPGGRRLVTDGRGEALSPPLGPGTYRVLRSRFSHAGGTVVEEPRAEEKAVRVAEGEVSTLRFTSGTDTWTVRFQPRPDPARGPWTLIVASAGERRTVSPANDGSYEIELPPEAARGRPVALVLSHLDEASGAESWTRVARLPAWPDPQTAESDGAIALPSGQIEGRALRTDTTASDAPAAGTLVRLVGFHDLGHVAETTTAPDGTFTFRHLPAGVYSLQIRDILYTYVSLGPGQHLDVGPRRLAPDSGPP